MTQEQITHLLKSMRDGIWVDDKYYVYSKDYIDVGKRDADVWSVEIYNREGDQLDYKYSETYMGFIELLRRL